MCLDSLGPPGPYSPWNSPGQNTGVGSLSFLQGIFPTIGLNPSLPPYRPILYQLSHKGSPRILEWVAYPFSIRFFPTQESNQGLLHCRQTLYQLNYQGNTNNILSEKELHFQKKKLVRRIGLFYIFENLFKLWLKEASWILISAFAFNL